METREDQEMPLQEEELKKLVREQQKKIAWLEEIVRSQGEELARYRRREEEEALLRKQVEEMVILRKQVEEIAVLRGQVEELSSQLEKAQDQMKKDSHNSSLPPSSDRFSRSKRSLRKKSGRKAGGQEGHEGKTLCQVSEPDEVIVQAVEECEHCQQPLQVEPVLRVERRQEWDMPPCHLIVREYQAEQKYCPRCQHRTLAAFPAGITAPVQYGPAIGAVGVYLVQQQLLPYERACETMEDLTGIPMTVGTLKKTIERCAKNLEPVEELIKEYLRKVDVRHQDETGLHVEDKRGWMHVTSTETVTHYAVHAKRGSEALDAIGLMKGFTGTSIHDSFGSYKRYQDCKHGGCNVHNLRDLKFQEEQKEQAWAKTLAIVLLDMKQAVARAREAGKTALDEAERSELLRRFDEAITEGYTANPPDPPPKIPKKGRRKQSQARNLLDRLSKNQADVLRFLDDFRVPFDNNQAERDLRMVKLQQKISGCFRSGEGATAFARIRGYLSTLRKQSLPILTALEMALVGHPLLPAL
jgi:transposase